MILRGVHKFAELVFPLAGFRWEVRRRGQHQIGLWRKSWRKPRSKNSQIKIPKRLIWVPGFGDTPLSWFGILTGLSFTIRKHYDEIIIFDFPGFAGFLKNEKAFHSMDFLMDTTFDIFDSLAPHTIFGHSLGAWLTARYAGLCGKGEYPKSTQKYHTYTGPEAIILASPSGVFGGMEKTLEWKQKFEDAKNEGFGYFQKFLFHKEPFWFRFLLKELTGFFKKEEIVQFIDSIQLEHFVQDDLPHVKCQSWLLWGEKDKLVDPHEWAEHWIEYFPADRKPGLVVMSKVGHSIQNENLLKVIGAIRPLLKV